MASYPLKVLTFLCVVIGTRILACDVSEWEDMSVQKRIGLTDIVVFGYDQGHVVGGEIENMARYDMKFMVECVLKGDGKPVSENIVVEAIEPLITCFAHQKVEVGNRYIQGLKRTKSGHYTWHLVNAIQETVWPFNQKLLDTIMEVCGIVPVLPNGTDPSMQNHCAEVTVDDKYCVRSGGLLGTRATEHGVVLVILNMVSLLMSFV